MVDVVAANAVPPLSVSEEKATVFRCALGAFDRAQVPYVLGGGLALYYFTGIRRDVHDLDVHLLPVHVPAAMDSLRVSGFVAMVKHAAWLAQAWRGDIQIDLVFGQGSWHASVDQSWIDRGEVVEFLGRQVRLVSPEDFFWSKALRCSRMRYDAPDLVHLLAARGAQIDWQHMLDIFGDEWEVLASHLVMFRFVYPSLTEAIPADVLRELYRRLLNGSGARWDGPPVCRGWMLDSSGSFRQDVEEWGFLDERKRLWEQRLRQEPVLVELAAREGKR